MISYPHHILPGPPSFQIYSLHLTSMIVLFSSLFFRHNFSNCWELFLRGWERRKKTGE